MSKIKLDGVEAKARQVAMQVAGALGLTVDGVMRSGAHRETTGRHITFYVLHAACGLSLGQIALALGVNRSTVASACKQIEERRDNREFDVWMAALERSAATAPAPADPVRFIPAVEGVVQ